MWERNGEYFYFDEPENESIWTSIVNLMDDKIREAVHREFAPCSKRIFIAEYLERDPEFEQVLAEEFGIEWL